MVSNHEYRLQRALCYRYTTGYWNFRLAIADVRLRRPPLTLLKRKLQCAIRNSIPLEERGVAHGATGLGTLHVSQDELDAREQFVGPMRFANESGHPCGQHAIDPVLRLRQESGAEEDDDVRVDRPQTPESFFAVHERHGKIEQNEIEPIGPVPELFEAFKPRLDGGNLVARLRENAVSQNAGGRIVVDNHDAARPGGRGVTIGFRRLGFG